MPVVIAKVIEILNTPFSGSAAPLDIRVVVLAFVVYIPDVMERCHHRQTLAQYYRHSVVGIVLYAVTLAVPIATDLAC